MCDSHVELTNVSIRGPNELRLSFYHAPTVSILYAKHNMYSLMLLL